jgi:hypothetical protein
MNDRLEQTGRAKPNNLRTGLLLGALALFFFCLLFVKKLWLG